MFSRIRPAAAAGMVLTLLGASAMAATVTVDFATQYQTIKGFGFFGPANVWWSGGPFYTDAWGTAVLDDLGITMWRNEYYSEEGSQDSDWAEQRPMVQSLKQKADALGVDLKFIYSVWTPPSQWKSNHSLKNGGTLLPQYYDEFGEWLVDGIDNYANLGIDFYAVSPQNEPAFEEYYNSCVYTPEQYRDMIKVVGPIIHAAYPNVKIFGAEDMLSRWVHPESFLSRLVPDLDARAQMGALAVHGYNDGVTPTPASQAVQLWSGAAKNCASIGYDLWMTETSGYDSNWDGAMNLAEMMHAALRFGKIAAWVHWYGTNFLEANTNKNKKYYAAKHIYRYVRPGAVMVDVTDVSTEGVLVTAYAHAANRTMTVVAVNSNSSSANLTITGTGLPSEYTVYRSTSSVNCASQGTSGNTISLPASSITTLYATNYDPPLSTVTAPRSAGRTPVARTTSPRVYDLTGRLVGGETALGRNLTPGTYCRLRDTRDGTGNGVELLMAR